MSERKPLVLVVEDDPGVRGLLAELMAGQGYEVVTARDGLEGLVKLELRHPSLVILDIRMPDVEGDRVLAEMRADVRTRSVPVVVVSGVAEAHRRFDPLVGRANVFPKPFDVDALVRRVGELLGEGAG